MKRFWRAALPLGAALCLIPATPAEEPDKAEGTPARRLRVFDGQHEGPPLEGGVYRMVLTPDGKTVISSGNERTVRWWDFATGKELRRLKDFVKVGQIALSSDGKRLATSAAVDKKSFGVTVWNASTGERVYQAEGHRRWATAVAFSPDGSRLASGGDEGDILIREADTGKLRQRLKSDNSIVRDLAFSPDGRLLFASYDRRYLSCWDLVLGRPIWEVQEFPPVALSPNGDLVAAVRGGVRLYESLTGTVCAELVAPPPPNRLIFVCFGADGRTVVLAGEHHSIWSWDVASGRRLPTFAQEEKRPHALTPVPHSDTLLVATSGGSITLWALPKPPEPAQRAEPPTEEDLGRLWADLAVADAAKTFHAAVALRRYPAQAVAFLRARVRLLPANELRQIRELVAALDADSFRVRTKAVAALVNIGDKARPALRLAYAREGASAELRQRAEEVYDKLKGRGPAGDYLQARRAIRILRSIGTKEAWAALEELAKGPAEDGIADEARAALRVLSSAGKR